MNRTKPRIGVYVCRCGTNIAATVNVEDVVAYAGKLGNVELAKEYSYMCSDPGQDMIKEDIQANDLNRVVVASCSPLMHEATFKQAVSEAGLNPYYFQMANIREQCSWVISKPDEATEKAKKLVESAVNRVYFHRPLDEREVEMEPSVLVVGAGIAGIEASLKLADAGKKVYLVERESSIGGHMAQIYKTFPTLDCAA
jgi:heterodisulfide reductase subunit A